MPTTTTRLPKHLKAHVAAAAPRSDVDLARTGATGVSPTERAAEVGADFAPIVDRRAQREADHARRRSQRAAGDTERGR